MQFGSQRTRPNKSSIDAAIYIYIIFPAVFHLSTARLSCPRQHPRDNVIPAVSQRVCLLRLCGINGHYLTHRPTASMNLDFSGLQVSLASPSIGGGRISRLSDASLATARSFDTDTVISLDSSLSDISLPTTSGDSDADSEGPIAMPPLRRRVATRPRRPPTSRQPSTSARVSNGRSAPLQPSRAFTRSRVPITETVRSTSIVIVVCAGLTHCSVPRRWCQHRPLDLSSKNRFAHDSSGSGSRFSRSFSCARNSLATEFSRSRSPRGWSLAGRVS